MAETLVMLDEYVCQDCGYVHENYNQLRHYYLDSGKSTGGFCASCNSDWVIPIEEEDTDEEV